MYVIKCTIEGLVGSMWDRFYNQEEIEQPTVKSKDSWKAGLMLKLNVDKKGVYCPVDNLRMMLIGNSSRKGAAQIVGSYMESGKGTEYKSFCEAFIWVVGMEDNQKVYFEPKRKKYDDYDERSVPTGKGARVLKRRPLVKVPWRLTFLIHVMDNQFDESKIRQLFEVAGMRCGVGAYGPTFGRFRITEWTIINTDKAKKKKRKTKKAC
jgi:hypothetical protein